jgi:hypothetical protein
MLLRIVTATGIVVGLVAAAQAATLATGPLRVENGDSLTCYVVNVSQKEVEVTITNVLDNTILGNPFAVPAGQTFSLTNNNSDPTPLPGYCLFDVNGGKGKVRASACVYQGSLSCQASLPAS